MAIKSVQFKLNGQTYNLTYDNTSQAYQATITAPTVSSFGKNSDNKYHCEVVVTDTANNTVTATVADFETLAMRVLEKTKPVITASYPATGSLIGSNKPTFTWEVTDNDSGIDQNTITLKLDSGGVITSGINKSPIEKGFRCTYTPNVSLNDGTHNFSLMVSDNDGNVADTPSITFKIDTTPPTLNVTSPVDNFITNNASQIVSGTTNDAVSSPVTLTVNNQNVDVNPNGSFSTIVTLTEGVNTITVIAKDSAGKTTTVTRTVTLDTKVPKITSVSLVPNPVDAGQTYVVTVKVGE